MNARDYLTDAALLFAIVFVVNGAVVYLWNLVFHGTGVFEWDTAFFFALTLAIVLPLAGVGVRKGRGA